MDAMGCYLLVDFLVLVFYDNNLTNFWWILFIILIFAWFINYYAFFFCLILYFHVVLFLDLFFRLFWYDVGVILVVLVLSHFLYCIVFFHCLMDINFLFQRYFFLNPLTVLVFKLLISCFNCGVFIVIPTSDCFSRAPIKIRGTINYLWCSI